MREVSIIVPIYNTEKYIENFLKSVIYQTFKDFELVLVNDGSSDNSIKIANDILKMTEIEYKIINKENGGQSSARNVGIKEAKGKWVVLPDSDDVLQKDYLEIMHKYAENDSVDVVICNINSVTDNTIFQETIRNNKCKEKTGRGFFVDFILHNISIGPISLMINRQYLNRINLFFNENSRYSEEFIFICYLLFNARKVVHAEEKLYNYCLRKGSVSTGADIEIIVNGYEEILKSNVIYNNLIEESCILYQKYATARWILATARFTATNLKYDQYKILMNKLNAKNEIKKLLTFPNFKIKMASLLFIISMPLFYRISKM